MEHDKTAGLILRARNGDADAFVELMERNKQSMYKTAKAWLSQEEDVADAISETILDCFEHLDTLREPRYFKTWLVRILINNCSNIRRKADRRRIRKSGAEMTRPGWETARRRITGRFWNTWSL